MSIPRMQSKRDARRLEKAEKAALLDKKIEKELIERLKKGAYDIDGIYNPDEKQWIDFLEEREIEEDVEEGEVEFFVSSEVLEEEDDMEDYGKDAMMFDDDDDEAVGTDEDSEEADRANRRGFGLALRTYKDKFGSKSKRKATVHVEVENEDGGGTKRLKSVH